MHFYWKAYPDFYLSHLFILMPYFISSLFCLFKFFIFILFHFGPLYLIIYCGILFHPCLCVSIHHYIVSVAPEKEILKRIWPFYFKKQTHSFIWSPSGQKIKLFYLSLPLEARSVFLLHFFSGFVCFWFCIVSAYAACLLLMHLSWLSAANCQHQHLAWILQDTWDSK